MYSVVADMALHEYADEVFQRDFIDIPRAFQSAQSITEYSIANYSDNQ